MDTLVNCYIYFIGNKMDTNNMAIVIGPNIVVKNSNTSDYSVILTEMEMTQRLVEMLILHVFAVFDEK